jgi:iron complex outermembrane receptor protein
MAKARSKFILGANLIALAMSGRVLAQETLPDVEDLTLNAVMVTAQKREQNLQDVPVSVDAYSAELVANANVTRVEELVQLSPSLTFDTKRDFGTSSLRIRGIGTLVLDSGVEPSVATVVDGIVMSQGAAVFNEFPDIERIEVLNGPQGALFGKNASAGLVNIITKRPNTDKFESFIEARAAQDNDYKTSFSISGPIIDYLSLRLSGYQRKYNGNVRNIVTGDNVNGVDATGIRGRALFTPQGNIEALLTVDYTEQNSECCQRILRQDTGNLFYESNLLTPPFLASGSPFSYAGPRLTGTIGEITQLDVNFENDQVAVDREPINTTENYGVTLELNFDLGAHILTSITGARRFKTLGTRDNDESPLPLNTLQIASKESRWISQEFRLTSPAYDKFDYILGGYFYSAENNNFDTFERIISVSLNPAFSPDNAGHFIQSGFARGEIENTNFAVFGNLNYKVADRLKLFGGFRLLQDEIEGTVSGTRVDLDPRDGITDDNNAAPALIKVAPLSSSESDTALIGRLGAQYELSDNAMVYASLSRGFKGRGYSTEFFVNADRFGAEPVEPEEATSYETGLRSAWNNNTFIANVTIFRTEIDGFQLTFRDLDTLINSLNSVPSIVSQGVEADFVVKPFPGFTWTSGLSYVDATYDEFPNDPREGLTLPNAPKFKIVNTARYEADLSKMFEGFLQASYRYQSDVNYLNDGSGFSDFAGQEGFGILDLSAGFATQDGRYEASMFVKNAADEFYVTGISPNGNAGGGFVLHALARDYSRYIGGSIRVRF